MSDDPNLMEFIEEIEPLEEEKRKLSEQIKEIYARAKGSGLNTKAMKRVVRDRQRERDDVKEENSDYDLYAEKVGLL